MLVLSPENQEVLDRLKDLHSKGKLFGMMPGIPNEVYHHPECPGISNSNLNVIDDSYADFKRSMEIAKEEIREVGFRDKFFLGNAFHMLTLEGDLFYDTFCVEPTPPEGPKVDKRYKEGKAVHEKWVIDVLTKWEIDVYSPWVKENSHKIKIPSSLWEELHQMYESVISHPIAKKMIENSDKEVTFFGFDAETGITLKCRADMINIKEGWFADLKSTYDSSYLGFRRACVEYNYDKQSALYRDIIHQVTGSKLEVRHIATRKKKSANDKRLLLTAVYAPDEAMLDMGKQLYRRSLHKIKSVHSGEEAEGYPLEIQPMSLPAYGFDLASR